MRNINVGTSLPDVMEVPRQPRSRTVRGTSTGIGGSGKIDLEHLKSRKYRGKTI
jgi:hypothetical protein